jgi:hypothetical protein
MRAPPLPLAPGVELRINGQLLVVRSISPTGEVKLECPVRLTTLSFALSELVSMRMAGNLVPVHAPPVTHQVSGVPRRGLLQPAMRERVTRRMAYGQAALQQYPVGPKSERLKRLIAEVAERIGDSCPPSPHSVYRWVRRCVASDYNTAVFMQDGDVTRTRRPRKMTDDVSSTLREHIQILLGSNKGATLHGITNLALAKTAKDLGYIQFKTKEGVSFLVDDYLQAEQAQPKSLAALETTRTQSRQRGLGEQR